MRVPRFAKILVAFLVGVMLLQLLHACSPRLQAAEKTTLTVNFAICSIKAVKPYPKLVVTISP